MRLLSIVERSQESRSLLLLLVMAIIDQVSTLVPVQILRGQKLEDIRLGSIVPLELDHVLITILNKFIDFQGAGYVRVPPEMVSDEYLGLDGSNFAIHIVNSQDERNETTDFAVEPEGLESSTDNGTRSRLHLESFGQISVADGEVVLVRSEFAAGVGL